MKFDPEGEVASRFLGSTT